MRRGKKYQFHAYLRLNYIPRLGHRTSNVHEILSNNHIKVENGEEAYRVRWQSVTLTWVPLCDSLHALQSRGDLNKRGQTGVIVGFLVVHHLGDILGVTN